MSLIVTELQRLTKTSETARRVFACLAERKRSRQEQDLLRFRQSFPGIDHDEFKRLFIALQNLKIGRLVIGPNDALKRFHWIFDQVSIGRTALGLNTKAPSLFGEMPKRLLHRDKPNAPAPILASDTQGTFETLLLVKGEVVHIMGSIQAQVDLLSRLNAWDALKQIRRVKSA